MKSKILLFKFWVIALLIFCFIKAQAHNIELINAEKKPVVAQQIDTYLTNLKDFSGAILVAYENKIIISKGYGFANYELDIPNTSETKFRIASISKQFTAMAIMQLQEKNLLDVKYSLTKYIPDFPNGEKITIHHLLTHTSGIKNYTSSNEIHNCTNLEEVITHRRQAGGLVDWEHPQGLPDGLSKLLLQLNMLIYYSN